MRLGMVAGVLALATGLAGCEDMATTTPIGVSYDRNVLVNNQTGETVWRLYGSRSTTNSWEEDILGANVLPNGQSVRVNFNDGTGSCVFDFRFELRSGRVIEDYGINVCQVASYTVR